MWRAGISAEYVDILAEVGTMEWDHGSCLYSAMQGGAPIDGATASEWDEGGNVRRMSWCFDKRPLRVSGI